MHKLKCKKIVKGLGLGIGLTALTLFVLFTVLVWYLLTGGPAKKTKDISRYQEIFDLHYISANIVFPEKVSEDVVETDFYFYYRDMLFDPTYQVYFQCTYEPEAFEQEIDRLNHVHKTYAGKEKKLLRDNQNKYNYPVYIAMEKHNCCYEYALITGENQITYISTAYVEANKMVCDKDYLPIDFMTDHGSAFGSGYCIYESSSSDMYIDYDSTRNENVEVRDCHMEQIQDSFFIVNTLLDENDKEIIEEIHFDYYESKEDDGFTSTDYTDLNGMEYRSLTLNEERTKAIVVYYDGSEEKEFVVELPFPEEK